MLVLLFLCGFLGLCFLTIITFFFITSRMLVLLLLDALLFLVVMFVLLFFYGLLRFGLFLVVIIFLRQLLDALEGKLVGHVFIHGLHYT